MRWRSAAALACALLGACGGPGELSTSEQRAVERTLRAYAGGMAERDGEAACATLTVSMRRRHERGGEPCARVIVGHARLLEFRKLVRVEVNAHLPARGRARGLVRWRSGAGTSGAEVTLERERGRWLIDEDITCLQPGCSP